MRAQRAVRRQLVVAGGTDAASTRENVWDRERKSESKKIDVEAKGAACCIPDGRQPALPRPAGASANQTSLPIGAQAALSSLAISRCSLALGNTGEGKERNRDFSLVNARMPEKCMCVC